MSNEAITAVARSAIHPSGRKFVAMALADYADEEWSCFPSVEQLARYTSQGEKTVRDHLIALESEGIMTRVRRRNEDGTLGRYRFKLHRRNLPVEDAATTGENHPVADLASGEKQPEPAADFAGHNPHIEPSTVFSAREFAEFWSAYPNKVGKRAAEKAFTAARKRVSFPEMMSGLNAYVNKRDDRAWCNPATWLNQDRWADAPATVQPRGSPHQRPRSAQDAVRDLVTRMQNADRPDQNSRPDQPLALGVSADRRFGTG